MTARFWAKTEREGTPEGVKIPYHSVICHLADTATVAMAIVRDYLSDSAIATLEKGLKLQGESLIKCCGFLAGLHDLGKVSPAFQFLVPDLCKELVGEHFHQLFYESSKKFPDVYTPHSTVTAKTMPELLRGAGLGNSLPERKADRLAKKLAVIVGGHHGYFPSNTDIQALKAELSGTNPGSDFEKKRFPLQIFTQLQEYIGVTEADLPTTCNNAATMILAGLTTVSDWIASNNDADSGFTYANDMPFDEYRALIPDKAKNALQKLGWSKNASKEPLKFSELFPNITTPRPLQNAAIELTETLKPPCLVIAEASMGEGKTETALYLADYLQHQSSAGGFYIGLPTQATSNAMWQRVTPFLATRYPTDVVNLTLSHSGAALMDDYQKSRLEKQIYDDPDNRKSGNVGTNEWYMERKRSLLSPYGVGTIDQGLMGVVRSKHQFVRLFGLAGRTVILDEVHAYDLYTSTLIERLLEWLAVLGSPVILLSATLPTTTRHALLSAYARGCGVSVGAVPEADYPRITTFSDGKATVKSFTASEHVQRSLNLKWVKDEEWDTELVTALANGGCASVICSTVDRAQEVFRRLQNKFADDELGLFHGRFLAIDRARIEKDCLIRFGKPSDPKTNRPYRYVLVATQVVEQSLDLDFDLMISDMAPIDLLLQRSGRLHRHAERNSDRPDLLKNPTMWLIKPKLNPQGTPNFSESEWIYDRHVILRTWLTLRDQTFVQLPQEMDQLIESVYRLDTAIPSELETVHQQDWQTSLDDYQAWQDSNKAQANEVKLPPAMPESHPSDFTRAGEADDDNAIARVTRLGDPSVTTIFLQQTTSGYVLPQTGAAINIDKRPDLEGIRRLLGHSTRIGKRGLVPILMAQSNPNVWSSALLRNCRYVVLDEAGKVQVGKWELALDPLRGVLIRKIS